MAQLQLQADLNQGPHCWESRVLSTEPWWQQLNFHHVFILLYKWLLSTTTMVARGLSDIAKPDINMWLLSILALDISWKKQLSEMVHH